MIELETEQHLRGEKNHNCKTSEELAGKIKLSKGNGTKLERANEFSVSLNIVADIDFR